MSARDTVRWQSRIRKRNLGSGAEEGSSLPSFVHDFSVTERFCALILMSKCRRISNADSHTCQRFPPDLLQPGLVGINEISLFPIPMWVSGLVSSWPQTVIRRLTFMLFRNICTSMQSYLTYRKFGQPRKSILRLCPYQETRLQPSVTFTHDMT